MVLKVEKTLKKINKLQSKIRKKAHYIVADCWRRDLSIFNVSLIDDGIWFSFWDSINYADVELKNNGKINVVFSKVVNNSSTIISSQSSRDSKKIVDSVYNFYKN